MRTFVNVWVCTLWRGVSSILACARGCGGLSGLCACLIGWLSSWWMVGCVSSAWDVERGSAGMVRAERGAAGLSSGSRDASEDTLIILISNVHRPAVKPPASRSRTTIPFTSRFVPECWFDLDPRHPGPTRSFAYLRVSCSLLASDASSLPSRARE